MKDLNIKIYQGNALEVLKDMDSESIDMCCCSPPYWGLRDYGEDGQLGLEPTYQEYIGKLVAIFDEVKRVLKDTGTCWVNLGDTYGGAAGGYCPHPAELGANKHQLKRKSIGLDKSLIGIPERFSIAMTDAGWIRRNTIIWYKPNCMPSSADDRFTVDFEYLYFFTKKTRYWFEQQFEPHLWADRDKRSQQDWSENKPKSGKILTGKYAISHVSYGENGRNKRCVWKISTQSYNDAHFATYPEELVYTPIKAGCPKGGTVLDPFMGSGTTLKVARELGRKGIGIELNKEYIDMAKKRIGLEQSVFGFKH
ncbi:MAG: DNA-methyltransferase [Candidatus Scalindua sp.]